MVVPLFDITSTRAGLEFDSLRDTSGRRKYSLVFNITSTRAGLEFNSRRDTLGRRKYRVSKAQQLHTLDLNRSAWRKVTDLGRVVTIQKLPIDGQTTRARPACVLVMSNSIHDDH